VIFVERVGYIYYLSDLCLRPPLFLNAFLLFTSPLMTIGKTLYEVCDLHNIWLGPANPGAPPEVKRTETWIEPTFGEGCTSGFDHVILVGNGVDTAERMTPIEEQMLEEYWDWDEIFEGSRLASAVTLTKAMDGMIVYVPDRLDSNIG
jgi:hypothetical protein